MFKLSNSLPVFLAAIIGIAAPMMKQETKPAKDNPFDSVQVVQSQPEVEQSVLEVEQLPSVNDVLLQETYQRTETLGRVAHSLKDSTSKVSQRLETLVSKVSELEAKQDEAATKATGPGFKMPDLNVTECDCDCFTEAEIRKIVSDEFNNQKLAEAVAPRNYASGVTYRAPAVTYQTPNVTYYQAPTVTYQSSAVQYSQGNGYKFQPVRKIFRGTSCVIDAFGNKICTPVR